MRAERAACPPAQATLAVRAGALHVNPAHQDTVIEQRLIIGIRGGCGRKKKDGVSNMNLFMISMDETVQRLNYRPTLWINPLLYLI